MNQKELTRFPEESKRSQINPQPLRVPEKVFVPPASAVSATKAEEPEQPSDNSESSSDATEVAEEPNKEFKDLSFRDIIVSSTLRHPDLDEQARNIVRLFNQNRPSIMVESVAMGKRIQRDEFRLVHRNNFPELVPFTRKPLRMEYNMTGTTEEIGVFKQNDLCIGAHGSYVVNVPQGKICKAWYGNRPVLLGEGPHVIHSNNFKLQKGNPLVSISATHIAHGTINIVRVPVGYIAKIWLDNCPYILESRPEPYVFNTPTFKLVSEKEDAPDAHNAPANDLGRGIAQLVKSAEQEKVLFLTSEKLIRHGPIKRVMPKTGEVAITYKNGILEIIEPTKTNEPTVINDPNHIVEGFIETTIQTLTFPSEKTIAERERNSHKKDDFNSYEEFRTKDGMPIGVKLLVVYIITDPKLLLSELSRDQIVPHIENLVVADMGSVIQQCSSSDFQSTGQTKTMPGFVDTMMNHQAPDPSAPPPPNNPEFVQHLQDSVKNKLSADFAEYGIKLDRINIETPKILDKEIADKLSEFSLMNSKATAKEAVLDKQYNIAKREAEQKAKQLEIQQMQDNQNMIRMAKAKLEAAEMEAKAITIKAQAEAEAQKSKFAAQVRNKVSCC